MKKRLFSLRVAMMLLVMTLITVAQTAWAETFNTSYMDVDGSTKYVDATVLTGEETNLQAGWYVAVGNINYTKRLSIAGDVHLILADGCQMNIGTSENRLNTDGLTYITGKGIKYSLTIYGQSTGSDMGLLSVWVTGDRKMVFTFLTLLSTVDTSYQAPMEIVLTQYLAT